MSRQTFENYGVYAGEKVSFTRISGRYTVQAEGERKIAADVREKLKLNPSDTLLEIGCGPGNLLIPLSFSVASATGIDHPKVISRFQKRFQDEKVRLIAGNFLDLKISDKYSKILIYSMIQLLADEEEVRKCISKAMDLLKPGGLLLIGDLPNEDKKSRFLSGKTGRKFLDEWNRINKEDGMSTTYGKPDPATVHFTDRLVLDLMFEERAKGAETYLLPQKAELPFGRTREDLLISKALP